MTKVYVTNSKNYVMCSGRGKSRRAMMNKRQAPSNQVKRTTLNAQNEGKQDDSKCLDKYAQWLRMPKLKKDGDSKSNKTQLNLTKQ